jgi:hypothetical protein
MPRLHGVRERRHQPFWDSLIRTTGDPTPIIQQSSKLFGNANVGNLALTNLQVAGQLASDQTYVILALRCWLYFDGTNARANYLRVASQLYFTLNLGDKPQFQAPCWYFPAGGGIYGTSGATAGNIFNHGYPSQNAILKLARPIVVPVRQNFNCDAQFFTVGSTNALTTLNTGATDDQKVIAFMLDGGNYSGFRN